MTLYVVNLIVAGIQPYQNVPTTLSIDSAKYTIADIRQQQFCAQRIEAIGHGRETGPKIGIYSAQSVSLHPALPSS